jgi:hypothetical protein
MEAPPVPMFAMWLPALEAGTLPLQELVAWADGQILALPNPPMWLIELSLATDLRGVERAATAVPEPVSGWDSRELYLGFLYLAHEDGKLPLDELLLTAGQFADGQGYGAVPECEAFYYLLNEIDGGGPTLPSDRPLTDRVRELFAPMTAKASDALHLSLGGPRAG